MRVLVRMRAEDGRLPNPAYASLVALQIIGASEERLSSCAPRAREEMGKLLADGIQARPPILSSMSGEVGGGCGWPAQRSALPQVEWKAFSSFTHWVVYMEAADVKSEQRLKAGPPRNLTSGNSI